MGQTVSRAMLMAAGLGTRLKPFTDLEPKALMPLMGIPMAQFAVDALAQAGVRRIVANIHHLADRARSGLGALELGGAEMVISDESGLLLGSAGGIKKAMPELGGGPFFLVNADVLSEVDLGELARQHLRLRSRYGVKMTLALNPAGPPGGLYREIQFDPSTQLMTRLGELAVGRPYFIGAAVLEPEALAHVPAEGPAEFVPTILQPLLAENRIGVHFTSGLWFDVGSPGLWVDAHVGLIRGLETGKVAGSWRRRIERVNKRVGQEMWISAQRHKRRIRVTEWVGPCYWNPLGDDTADAPRILGPRAILYGQIPGERYRTEGLADGIGFRGVWTPVTS